MTSNSPDIAPTTSLSLINRVRKGDQKAWEQLVHIYSPIIYSRCRSCELQPDDAADVMQRVFLGVHSGIERFEPKKEQASFRSWLRRIAANSLSDHFREQASKYKQLEAATLNIRQSQFTDAFSEADSTSLEPSNSDERQQTAAMITKETMRQVRDDYEHRTWKAFWRTTIDGQNAKKVAEELGMTHGAVRTAAYTIRKRLREELDDLL